MRRTAGQVLEDGLTLARQRGGVNLTIEGYCQAQDCTVRTVTVLVKEAVEPTVVRRWACPICGAGLKLHHVQTEQEAAAVARREARMSVNEERWLRDHPGEFGVPMSAFLNDELPA